MQIFQPAEMVKTQPLRISTKSTRLTHRHTHSGSAPKQHGLNTDTPTLWHRRKLPFEILNFAKFCHKNWQILPLKIANFATFCHKNCQILQIKFSFQCLFWSRRPRILNRSKDAHKND